MWDKLKHFEHNFTFTLFLLFDNTNFQSLKIKLNTKQISFDFF